MDGSLALGQAYAVVILGSESLVIHYEHAALTMPLRRAHHALTPRSVRLYNDDSLVEAFRVF